MNTLRSQMRLSQVLSTTALILLLTFAGCSYLPSSGPSRFTVNDTPTLDGFPVQVVDIDENVARKVAMADKHEQFSDMFPTTSVPGYKVGNGDTLQLSIWEAPPPALFMSTSGSLAGNNASLPLSRQVDFPDQVVSRDGSINVPFAGAISVVGKTLQEVQNDIVRRLKDKAHDPQALVRLGNNATSYATIMGVVPQSMRLQLTAKGERLLDAIAAAGGVQQPVGQITLRVSRGNQVQAMTMDNVIQDPKQNIMLHPGDIVTALHQPLSFTALGSTGQNSEIFFETKGISLVQALARAGGTQDQRADATGVFIFRFEEPQVLGLAPRRSVVTPDGKTPTIYRVDLKDPRSFLVAQSFPIHNKDVLYISNAPLAELQKVLNMLSSIVFSARGFSGGSLGF